MTHDAIVAALRQDVERHCDTYRRRQHKLTPQEEPQVLGEKFACERGAVASPVSHATRSRGADLGSGSASPTPYTPPTCVCSHPSGDHQPIRGAGVFARQSGRCLIDGCECASFTETPLSRIPGTPRYV